MSGTKIVCPNCDEGYVECNECDGFGVDEDGEGCYLCDATGEMGCDVCDGNGKIECPDCGGEGEVCCGNCNGSGEGMYDGGHCTECHSNGTVPCTTCKE